MLSAHRNPHWRLWAGLLLIELALCSGAARLATAQAPQEQAPDAQAEDAPEPDTPDEDVPLGQPEFNFADMIEAGGWIGYGILFMSLLMAALFFEHLLSIRRGTLMPAGLADEVHRLIAQNEFKQAEQQCKLQPSFLAYVLSAGLIEAGQGYNAVEKAMEDASTEQSARLFRKIEWLSVIGTIAPMVGLFGTVWGMILAFREFESQANPQVAQLAPGIYKALVTTLMGLAVAVPSLASFAYFRNRIDELVAQSTLMAEHVFADYKRTLAVQRRTNRKKRAEAEPKL